MTEKELKSKADPEKTLSRESLMEITSDIIRDLQQKGINGRFRDPDNERMRDAKTRLLIQVITAYAAVPKDHELSQLEQRIADLERGQV